MRPIEPWSESGAVSRCRYRGFAVTDFGGSAVTGSFAERGWDYPFGARGSTTGLGERVITSWRPAGKADQPIGLALQICQNSVNGSGV
jgi:hypothetical protein